MDQITWMDGSIGRCVISYVRGIGKNHQMFTNKFTIHRAHMCWYLTGFSCMSYVFWHVQPQTAIECIHWLLSEMPSRRHMGASAVQGVDQKIDSMLHKCSHMCKRIRLSKQVAIGPRWFQTKHGASHTPWFQGHFRTQQQLLIDESGRHCMVATLQALNIHHGPIWMDQLWFVPAVWRWTSLPRMVVLDHCRSSLWGEGDEISVWKK